jgi:hypothetical protein
LNVYGGWHEENEALAELGLIGGTLEVGGGLIYGVGSYRVSGPLMSAGSSVARAGGIIAAPVVLWHAKEDLESGNEYRQMRGALGAAGVVAPPAAVLSVYNEVVVQPAARTFYETARHWIAQELGVPPSWVY